MCPLYLRVQPSRHNRVGHAALPYALCVAFGISYELPSTYAVVGHACKLSSPLVIYSVLDAAVVGRRTVYTMCTQKPPNNWSEHLYNNYCDAVKDYLSARILPRIKEKHDEAMLRELVRRWENHKLMIKFLSHVFKYLDRFYVKRLSLPELAEVGSQRCVPFSPVV